MPTKGVGIIRCSAGNPVASNLHPIRATDGIFQQAAVFLDDAFRGNILRITCDQQTFHAKLSGSFDTKPQGFGAVTATPGVRYDAVADMAAILGQIVVQCQTQAKYANQRAIAKADQPLFEWHKAGVNRAGVAVALHKGLPCLRVWVLFQPRTSRNGARLVKKGTAKARELPVPRG